jgi:phosphotransferase family enzyme
LYSGPDALSFVRAIINIQQKWLKEFAPSRSINEVMSRSTLDTSPDFHTARKAREVTCISLFDQLLAVIPHVLPPDEISFPVLWHTDLHAGNIMVKPEDKPDLVGILDWQGMSVTPLFMQSVFAKFVRYTGDDRIVVPLGIKMPPFLLTLNNIRKTKKPI